MLSRYTKSLCLSSLVHLLDGLFRGERMSLEEEEMVAVRGRGGGD